MKKYWVTVEDDVFLKLEELARREGMSVGAFSARHLTALTEDGGKTGEDLTKTALRRMRENLEEKQDTIPFNVSGIVNDEELWGKLSRSDKMIMAKSLSRYVKDHEERFELYKIENSIRFYRLKKSN